VLLDGDAAAGNLCTITDSPNLYIGDGIGTCGDGGDTLVSGLTVNSGATLVLVDNLNATSLGIIDWSGYGVLQMTNDLVVNGTIKTDAGSGLYIEANLIQVGTSGKITTSATAADTSATEIYLGYDTGITMTIINHGVLEAKGLGIGWGGHIYLRADDLVVNYGTIDTSGGTSDTGAGGNSTHYAFEAYVDYGDFYSSGIVRMNGGDGGNGNGGDGGWSWVETASTGNTVDRNGDIIISGTWEAKGGKGTNGNGGTLSYMGFKTDAMGKVYVNATMSIKGGNGTGATSIGGSADGIDFISDNSPGSVDVATPGKIRIAGHYDLRGGDGDLNGSSGGYLEVYSYGSTTAFQGTDVELIIPVALMSGGTGSAKGGDASSWALEAYTFAPQYPNIVSGTTNTNTVPSGSIVNQANIQAQGGKATGAAGTGGMGGYVELITTVTWWLNPAFADATTTVLNSGTIDISGGAGNTGGNAYGTPADGWDSLYLEAQNVTNTGTIKANGGTGILQGGDGAQITVNSLDVTTPSVNTGTVQTVKGAGTTPGADGEQYFDGALVWP